LLKGTDIAAVLALEVSEEELVKRLLNRGRTSGRSDDTNESVIRKRFAVYSNETEPVAAHYKKEKKFQSVKGEGSVEDIFNSISTAIDKKMKRVQ
jgi:adenylate kinase